MMKKLPSNKKSIFLFLLLFIFASLQFLTILNSKWPYVSDSLFYKHNYYQFQGDTYVDARARVLKNHPIPWKDKVQQNIFNSEETYLIVYKTFTKRPLYPFMATLLTSIGISEHFSFVIPIFVAFMGIILFNFYLCKTRFNKFIATISTLMLVSFAPFLWWATFFMTDTIGAFFWMLQIFLIFLYLTKNKNIYLKLFLVSLIISFLNREQSMLMAPLILTLIFLLKTRNSAKTFITLNTNLLKVTITAAVIFMFFIILLNQQTVWGNIIYIQNQYNLNDANFTFFETFLFYVSSVINAHSVFISNLIRSPIQILVLGVGLFGMAKTINLKIEKIEDKIVLDFIMISSAFASYLSIFLVPDFAYRFFTPLIISLIYFTLKYSITYFSQEIDLLLKPRSKTIK